MAIDEYIEEYSQCQKVGSTFFITMCVKVILRSICQPRGYGTIDLFMMLTEKYNKSQLCKRRRSY